MAWIDPLDKVPQVPQDWANHVIYGGVLGMACDAIAIEAELPMPLCAGAAVVLLVAALKKAIDYAEEGESSTVCIGKALATAAWPATLALFGA